MLINRVKRRLSGWFGLEKPIIATVDAWETWEDETRKKHPIKYFIAETIPGFLSYQFYRVYRTKVWIKDRIFPWRYNFLINTKLPFGYQEVDRQLLYASFAILCKFIETEHPHKVIAVRESQNRKDWQQVFKIYRYWTRHRPKLYALEDEITDRMYGDKSLPRNENREFYNSKEYRKLVLDHAALENRIYELDTKKIQELAKVRMCLWT